MDNVSVHHKPQIRPKDLGPRVRRKWISVGIVGDETREHLCADHKRSPCTGDLVRDLSQAVVPLRYSGLHAWFSARLQLNGIALLLRIENVHNQVVLRPRALFFAPASQAAAPRRVSHCLATKQMLGRVGRNQRHPSALKPAPIAIVGPEQPPQFIAQVEYARLKVGLCQVLPKAAAHQVSRPPSVPGRTPAQSFDKLHLSQSSTNGLARIARRDRAHLFDLCPDFIDSKRTPSPSHNVCD
jgi:hypothetical protein